MMRSNRKCDLAGGSTFESRTNSPRRASFGLVKEGFPLPWEARALDGLELPSWGRRNAVVVISISLSSISGMKKIGASFREAMQERNRSKVGRMARLKGQVERTEAPLRSISSPAPSEKVRATADVLRKAGAPESDIEEFLKSQGS
jgi:hypothetical protein